MRENRIETREESSERISVMADGGQLCTQKLDGKSLPLS